MTRLPIQKSDEYDLSLDINDRAVTLESQSSDGARPHQELELTPAIINEFNQRFDTDWTTSDLIRGPMESATKDSSIREMASTNSRENPYLPMATAPSPDISRLDITRADKLGLTGLNLRPRDPQVALIVQIVYFPGRSTAHKASIHVMYCMNCMVLVPFWSLQHLQPTEESRDRVAGTRSQDHSSEALRDSPSAYSRSMARMDREDDLPDDAYQRREVFAHYGAAMFHAQVLEQGLVNALTFAQTATHQAGTQQLFDFNFGANLAVTMGRLLHRIKPFLDNDVELVRELAGALELRNRLATLLLG